MDLIPPGASPPTVKPRSIDDVPILALTLWSKRYGDFELRRIAAQVDDTIKQTSDVSAVALIGGERREVRITLNQARLAAYRLSPLQMMGAWVLPIAGCLRVNWRAATGNISWRRGNSLPAPATCAMWWPASPTASRSSCATLPK
jgi:hypothetical protein